MITTPDLFKSGPRYHDLDGLRAAMMLLGLVLHAIVSYIHTPPGGAWVFRDPSGSVVWTHALLFIHVFRMPVFYVMAGFFAAMLLVRRGAGGLVRNRAARILVPFTIGWIILMPLTFSGFVFANGTLNNSLAGGWVAVREMPLWNGFYRDSTIHLWFLYDLLWLYLAALIVSRVVRWAPESWRRRMMNLFTRITQSRWRVLWLAIPTFGVFMRMPDGILMTKVSFSPDPLALLAYGLFFGFGWMVYLQRELLPSFGRQAWLKVVLALMLAPINSTLAIRGIDASENSSLITVLTAATAALMVWLLTFGLIGLFQRYLSHPRPTVRYLVDASYWVYLLHLPFMIWIPGLLVGVDWGSAAKVVLVLSVTTAICVFTYDLFVRSTLIGALLNGRRYPRGLPLLDEAGTPVEPACCLKTK